MSEGERIGVCFPRGFRAAGVTCGIKDSGAPDLALLACDADATAAGAFTRSRLAAAPVLVSREHLADGRARAVVVNSGNANACTGAQGIDDARTMASATARALGIAPGEVVVCSTGVIGKPLPMRGRRAGHRTRSGRALRERRRCRRRRDPHDRRMGQDEHRDLSRWAAGDVRIGVMGKGAGMIRPERGDHDRDRDDGRGRRAGACSADLLRDAADASLNLVSVDGSESTNDTLVVLASGASGVTASGADAAALGRALTTTLLDVARQMVADGEGASRFAHYTVTGARRRRRGAHRRARDRRGHPRALRAARRRPQLGPHAGARRHVRRRARSRARSPSGSALRSSSPAASR